MSAQPDAKVIFNAAASGTQNSSVFRVQRGEFFSIQVSHPGPGTTTTYTLEGSNTVARGEPTAYTGAVFVDQDARDKDNVALGATAKAAAVVFTIRELATCELYRLHMVTTLGSGTILAELARGGA